MLFLQRTALTLKGINISSIISLMYSSSSFKQWSVSIAFSVLLSICIIPLLTGYRKLHQKKQASLSKLFIKSTWIWGLFFKWKNDFRASNKVSGFSTAPREPVISECEKGTRTPTRSLKSFRLLEEHRCMTTTLMSVGITADAVRAGSRGIREARPPLSLHQPSMHKHLLFAPLCKFPPNLYCLFFTQSRTMFPVNS